MLTSNPIQLFFFSLRLCSDNFKIWFVYCKNMENTEKSNVKNNLHTFTTWMKETIFGILLLLSIIKFNEHWIMLYNFYALLKNVHIVEPFLRQTLQILIWIWYFFHNIHWDFNYFTPSDWAHNISHLIDFECFMHGKYINFIYILQSRTSIMPGT